MGYHHSVLMNSSTFYVCMVMTIGAFFGSLENAGLENQGLEFDGLTMHV